jgi:hypothetical protein
MDIEAVSDALGKTGFPGAQFPDKQEDIARFRQLADCRAEVLCLFRAVSFKM